MNIYGDLKKNALFPFASGQTSDEITKVARKKYIYRTNTTNLGSRKFELLTPSGSILSGSTKRYGLKNVCGRLFIGSVTPNELHEYNVETNTLTKILSTFNASHWYFTDWQNMIIGPDQTYDVLTGTTYSHVGGPNKYGRPFEYNGRLNLWSSVAGFKYNASGHKWDAHVNSPDDFGGFNFSNYTDETGVSSRSSHPIQGATFNGKLYIAGQSIVGEGMNHNTVFVWDGQKMRTIGTSKWTQASDSDGPWSLFRAGGRLWVTDRTSNVYNIDYNDTLTKSFVVPQDGLFGFHPIVYFGDEVISTVREKGTTWLVNDFAIYAFNGSRFAEIGDWDSQFPGCGIEGMALVNGYLYILGGVHLVAGTAFMARIYIGDLLNYNEDHIRQYFEVDRNIGSHLRGLALRTTASGTILDQRHKLLNRFRVEASGDLYSDSARGWELVMSNWGATERRPYAFGSFQGKLYTAGTDMDLLWRFNLDTRTVTSLGAITGTSCDQGRDSDGWSCMSDYFWVNTSHFNGGAITAIASPSITLSSVRRFRNEIYLFDTAKQYRFVKSSNTWLEVTSPTWAAFSSITGWIMHMVECRGFAFIYDYTNKKIYKWNGDSAVAAAQVFVDAGATTLGLMTLNNEVYLFTNGGANAGKVYRYNWLNNTFDTLIANCGYNIRLCNIRYPTGIYKDGCVYLATNKIADSSRQLIKFTGLSVSEICAMPNNYTAYDLALHNGDIYMLEYDESAYTHRLYRYRLGPLHQASEALVLANKGRQDINSLKCPPSGSVLPTNSAAGFSYGDTFYHTASGFFRRGINEWESQSILLPKHAELWTDTTPLPGEEVSLATGGTYYRFVSSAASGGSYGDMGIDVSTSGIAITNKQSAGHYLVSLHTSFAGTANVTFYAAVFKNEDRQSNLVCSRKIGTGGDVGNTGAAGVIVLDLNDELSVRFMAIGDSKTINVETLNLSICRIDRGH